MEEDTEKKEPGKIEQEPESQPEVSDSEEKKIESIEEEKD